MPDDFRVSITNSAGKNAYPISSFTWLLVPEQMPDSGKRKAMKDFLKWMLGPGQKLTEALEYAPLPKAVVGPKEKGDCQDALSQVNERCTVRRCEF